MKFKISIIALLYFFLLTGCEKENMKSQEVKIAQPNSTNQKSDLKVDKNWRKDIGEFKIYPLQNYDKTEGISTGFVPLTDGVYFDDHAATPVIAKEYLGVEDFPKYHILNKTHRDRFLKILKIKETDSIFIYNYPKNKLSTFLVKDIPIMAHITIYGGSEKIIPSDYLIGFDFGKKITSDNRLAFYEHFVNIGAENPFEKGGMKPMVWKKFTLQNLPTAIKIPKAKIKTIYKFQTDNRDYYLLNENHLIVLDAPTQEIIFDHLYESGEGSSLAELTIEGGKTDFQNQQWTGKMFKNKPPVVLGFIYESFGCESIDFIAKTGERLYILCDNRH